MVWNISDIMNALMAVPNLISLLALNKVLAKETNAYQKEVVLPEKLENRRRRREESVRRVA